jgi:hypothetical protein
MNSVVQNSHFHYNSPKEARGRLVGRAGKYLQRAHRPAEGVICEIRERCPKVVAWFGLGVQGTHGNDFAIRVRAISDAFFSS